MFKGANKYLEELVAQIDTPRLYQLSTTFSSDIDFDTPELSQFISRMRTIGACDEASLDFRGRQIRVKLQSHPEPSSHRMADVNIIFQSSDRQHSSLAQICALSLRVLSTAENLYMYWNVDSPPFWMGDVNNAEFLGLLSPYTAVKNLYLSKRFAPRIAPALQELTGERGERTTEVLPTLQNLYLEGFRPPEPVPEGIAQFISARQLTNRPVAILAWKRR
jgi:hypothetical protein